MSLDAKRPLVKTGSYEFRKGLPKTNSFDNVRAGPHSSALVEFALRLRAHTRAHLPARARFSPNPMLGG